MTNTAQHTPTPLSHNDEFSILGGKDPQHQIVVAEVYTKADRDFIVRAVNSHSLLVEALKELLDHEGERVICNGGLPIEIDSKALEIAKNKAVEALKQAEEV